MGRKHPTKYAKFEICKSAASLLNKVPIESQPIQKVHILTEALYGPASPPPETPMGVLLVQWNGSLCPGDQWWLMSVNNFPDNTLCPRISEPRQCDIVTWHKCHSSGAATQTLMSRRDDGEHNRYLRCLDTNQVECSIKMGIAEALNKL